MFCVWFSCFLESFNLNPNKVCSAAPHLSQTPVLSWPGFCIKRGEGTICGALRRQRGWPCCWRTCLHQLPLKGKSNTMRVASLTDSRIGYVATLKGKFVQKWKLKISHYILIHTLMESQWQQRSSAVATTEEDGDSFLNVQQKNNREKKQELIWKCVIITLYKLNSSL